MYEPDPSGNFALFYRKMLFYRSTLLTYYSMRKNLYTFLLLVASLLMLDPVFGQYQWRSLGPDNVSSITRALAFDQSANLYAGAQGGGLWRSVDLGESWSKLSSYEEAGCNPNITSIAIDGNTIYVATGATQFNQPYAVTRLGNPITYDYRTETGGFVGNLDGLPGGGVYVSTDNGANWVAENATNNEAAGTLRYTGPFTDIQKIIVSNGRVLIGTSEGVYYSDDQLSTVQKAGGSEFLENKVIFDLEVAANSTIFAIAHSTTNPDFTDSLFVSNDNGTSFSPVTSSTIHVSGRVGFLRSEIAVAPSDPNIVYLATTQTSGEVGNIYKHNISENSWQRIGIAGPTFSPLGISGQDAFVLSIYPDNPNELIIAGQNWYTLTEEDGWQLVGQAFNPSFPTYRESPMYAIAFHPSNPSILALGTENNLFVSRDRGETMASRNRGYGTQPILTVSSVKSELIEEGESTPYEAVIGGGKSQIIVNHLFNSELPSKNSFGTLSGIGYTKLAYSTIHPGGMIIQGTDGGLLRSLDYGLSFEQFYQIPLSPQVPSLAPADEDTIINQVDSDSEAGNLVDAATPSQVIWALDEFIPQDKIGQNTDLETLQEENQSYVFFCSKQYVWLAQGAFGDVLQARWNRLTSALVDGRNEVFTAMTVSKDGNHTVYVATSGGNIYRLDRAHDLANFDAEANVVHMNESLSASGLTQIGNWISSLDIDPQNPDRLIITYAGYGGFAQGITTPLWITDNAQDSVPIFGQVRGLPETGPLYTSKFVVDPDSQKSILLIGTEGGLLSVKGIRDLGIPFIPKVYTFDTESLTEEISSLSTTPVTDIFVRTYSWVETDDDINISRDYSTFVSTYGQGIWASSSFVAPRKGTTEEKPGNELVSYFFTKVYPNPSRGEASLQVNLPEKTNLEIKVLDLKGQIAYKEMRTEGQGIHRIELPASNLPEGLYIVEVLAKGETLNEKTVQKWANF